MKLSPEDRFRAGTEAARGEMFRQDKVWSKYSNDKVDIAHNLARVVRRLNRSLPLDRELSALSLGSSNEPQFRILESAFQGGLYLLDIEHAALEIVEERTERQKTGHVTTIRGDYREWFGDSSSVDRFCREKLGSRLMNLITLHHSLYYSTQSSWYQLFSNLYRKVLSPGDSVGEIGGAMHAVLMSSQSEDPTTTTGLYNHFAGRFFGQRNDQDLAEFGRSLQSDPVFEDAVIEMKTTEVEFFVDDFGKFMAVIWMILLHPLVHRFQEDQQREVIEYAYETFWLPRRALIQHQDHLVVYRRT